MRRAAYIAWGRYKMPPHHESLGSLDNDGVVVHCCRATVSCGFFPLQVYGDQNLRLALFILDSSRTLHSHICMMYVFSKHFLLSRASLLSTQHVRHKMSIEELNQLTCPVYSLGRDKDGALGPLVVAKITSCCQYQTLINYCAFRRLETIPCSPAFRAACFRPR